MPRRPLTRVERAEARLLTGPLGHFWAGAADVVTLVVTLARRRGQG